MSALRSAERLVTAGLAAVLGACASDSDVISTGPAATEIAVRPADFLGAVACGPSPGAMAAYVVTFSVYDDEEDVTPFVLPSSQPTPCSYPAGLRSLVVAGKRYTAEIDGYTLGAGALEPVGGWSSGSRHMHRPGSTETVVPRWTGRCGQGAASATEAELHHTRYVGGCEPLTDWAPSPTAIRIDPAVLLGPGPCPVVAFDLVTEQQALPPQFELACDAAPFDLAAEDGRLYRMLVSGKTAEGTPLGAECFAVGAAGLSVPPTCNPLSASGSLTVSLAGLLGEDDAPVCPAGMSFDLFDESLGLLNDVPLACTGQTHVGPLTPASYVLDAVVYDDAGLPHGPGATCTGSVAAGQSVPAVCF